GREWKDVFADPAPLIAKALEQKETAYYPDGRRLTACDGRVIPVAEAVAPLFDEKGKVNGAVGAFWDLTKEQSAERSREYFLTMVAHQLRSPLTGMLSALQLLQRRNLSSQQRAQLWSVVKSDGERLRKFADEFLGLEATVQSPRPLQMEPLSIAVIARSLVHKYGTERRGHRFRVTTCKPEPVVYADFWRVENVLDNLLDNAVSYSPTRSTVDVSVKSLGKDVIQVTVEDEGEGVAIEDRDRVFEPFYRSANLAGRHAYGHGLGLSIAQSMVKQMGGEIWVDARKDHGSAFHFTLRRYE
ncbi:MAG: HAMP domain-containing histidine kinase, partial [Chloroflexi bacterium]|nr:HAMP domain-containing histidine kinase [Chloroflexota bacterium]